VLGPERERLVYVGVEIGGLLPRDPVDEIQRNVVKSGITKMIEGSSDVVRTGTRSSTLSSAAWNVWAPRETRLTPDRRSRPASAGVTVSGFASTVTSAEAGKPCEQALQLRRLGESGRPTAEEDGFELRREQLPLQFELGQQAVDVGGVLAPTADYRDEIAVAAAVGAERQVGRTGAGPRHRLRCR